MSARAPAGSCCYGEDGHAPNCPLLTLPEVITEAVAADALVALAEHFDRSRHPNREWSTALERAAECGRRIKAARAPAPSPCDEPMPLPGGAS